jgi:hypothetical protein
MIAHDAKRVIIDPSHFRLDQCQSPSHLHNFTNKPQLCIQWQWSQIRDIQVPTEAAVLEHARPRHGHQNGRGQVIDDGGSAPAVQTTQRILHLRCHGEAIYGSPGGALGCGFEVDVGFVVVEIPAALRNIH